MLAKKTVKNQITLPKSIVDKIPDTEYFEVSLRGEEIVLKPVRIETWNPHSNTFALPCSFSPAGIPLRWLAKTHNSGPTVSPFRPGASSRGCDQNLVQAL
ncbi:MAG: AbrB/MazE/SpoVT family DNA-binding domain-containing protein [Deltaproteobacteria bacterium]|nr:AbrB/MazE/SpoVT family DNA-binding domain-containing protein [Deltaproteobacteria bacterium]